MSTIDAMDVLLVEDNPRDAEMTIRALRKRNLAHRLVWVRDGLEALDLLLATPSRQAMPRVILLDLKLPKLDGIEVLGRLKADERVRVIPVVVLTSSREEPDIERCYRLGANSYIVKPVNFENFSVAVSQLGMYWLMVNEPPRPDWPVQTP